MSVDTAVIKRAAAGKWAEIFSALAGLDAQTLDGQHHPCPRCGGTDRFRMIDNQAGAIFCNGCFSKGNGDGIAALQWLQGWDFPTAIDQLSHYLGIGNGNGRKAGNGKPQIVATFDYRDEQGNLLFQTCRREPGAKGQRKDFTQRRPTEGGKWEYKVKGTRLVLYRLPELVAADPAATVFIPEGEHHVDRLREAGQVATCNAMGAGKWRTEYADYLVGRAVVILADNDRPGWDHAQDVARSLVGKATSNKVVKLPGLAEKGDILDWLATGGTIEELRRLVDATPEWTPPAAPTTTSRATADKPLIVIGTDEERVTDEAIQALATRPEIYQRAGVLVHIVREAEAPKAIIRPQGAPQIMPLPRAALREKMAACAAWVHMDDKGETTPCHPPEWSVKAGEARGYWQGIRRLEAVVEAPILRMDGTILQAAGYDPLTGILYDPQAEFPTVPDNPTLSDAARAITELLEIVEDVPFSDDIDRAAWLAAALTPMARYGFTGPAPLVSIESNVRGAGKSLSADAIGVVNTGRHMARASAPEDNQEARKLITTIAMSGERMILLDNVAGEFGCAALDAALTAVSWTDRILGTNRMVTDAPLNAVWFATGNNIQYGADTARRVLPIRIESTDENPEERQGFHHPDLLEWVRKERPRLAVAGLTILRAFHAAGRPAVVLKPWGSFEGWSAAVRAPLLWCGLPDPAGGRQELRVRADMEATFLRRLLDGWQEIDPDAKGLTVAEAVKTLDQWPDKYQTLRAALAELPPPRGAKTPTIRSIGMKFHHLRRRAAGGRFLDSYDTRMGTAWLVAEVAECGTRGTSGTNSYPFAGAGARTHAHTEGLGTSPASGDSPADPQPDPAACPHDQVDETPTFDGYVNLTCRLCGQPLGCRRQEATR